MMRQLLGLILFATLVSTVVEAQTTRKVPQDFPTIQSAIVAAQNGDTVRVAPGIYVENINFLGKAITVVSIAGADVTTIDGNQIGTVVTMTSGEGPNSVIDGFTIRNGKGPFTLGGGIQITGSPTIRHNRIVNNGTCAGAGGISISSGSPIIQGNIISNNAANLGCSGGGGGGIFVGGPGAAQILDNTISNNSVINSSGVGGGIDVTASGPALIRGNIITGNSGTQGGGIHFRSGSNVTIDQNLIAGNSGSEGGGIYWLGPGGLTSVTNNTIVDNSANQQGSAIYADGNDGTIPVKNNIIIGKTGQAAIYCGNFNDINPPILAFNDVFVDQASAYSGFCADVTGTNGNISVAPLFVDRASQNYRLLAGSAGIDAGTNVVAVIPVDLDSFPRILPAGGTVDMGAYEFAAATTSTTSTTNLTFADQSAGTVSAPTDVTLTNTGTETLLVNTIDVSGDFSQTNTCQISNGIPSGQSCTVSIRFAPNAGGPRSGQLLIASNSASTVVSLSGNGTGGLSLSANSLTLTDQKIGTTGAATALTVSNTGTTDLSISSIAITGDFTRSHDCPATITAGAFCTISVRFAPTARGIRLGAVSIIAPGNVYVVSLSGRGITPLIVFSPTSLSFPNMAPGTTSAPQDVTISNPGDIALGISSISISGDFSGTNDCGSSLAVNSTCTVSVSFHSTGIGFRSGGISVVDDAPGSPQSYGLLGTSNGGFLTPTPPSINFGNQALNVTSSSGSITLRNTGNATMTVSSIATSGDFARTGSCTTLFQNSTCTLTVTFTPTSVGLRTGALTVTSNALGSPLVVPLSGTGIETVVYSTTSLGFSADLVGTTSPAKVITVTNARTVPLTVTGITNSGDFSYTTTCGASVPAGGNCAISVFFSPTATGVRNGSLSVAVDGIANNQIVDLSGTGINVLAAPVITALTPNTRAAGSTGATLAITGSGFSSLSVVRWGGVDRPTTLVNNNSLTATISDIDFATIGTIPVAVFNPAPGGGLSNSAEFVVYVAKTLTTKDLIFDRTDKRIYASVAAAAPILANTLTPIDPVSGVLGTSISIGTDPGKLAISSDSSAIFAALDGTAQVRPFDTASQTPGTAFGLGSDSFFGLNYAEDIAVSPGNPGTVAISMKFTAVSPRHAGVAIFDNGVKRPVVTDRHTGSNAIEFSASPSVLYGFNNETTEFGFRTMTVDTSGVTITNVAPNLINTFGTDILFEGGRIYSTDGHVIDPVGKTVLGAFVLPTTGGQVRGLAVDSTLQRAFILYAITNSVRILSYDINTFADTGSVTFLVSGAATGFGSLIRWGDKGLAFRSGTQVFTFQIPGSWVPSQIPSYTLAPTTGQQGQSNLNVAVTGQFTNFSQGQTTASFGSGITVNSVAVADATHATANLTIAPAATVGPRSVTISTGSLILTTPDAFTVTAVPGLLTTWGLGSSLSASPAGIFKAIATGESHSIALRADGTLAGWGNNDFGQSTPPAGTFTAIAVGAANSFAIRTDGTLVGWGYSPNGETSVPPGTFKAVAGGASHAIAIRTDGTLVGWGNNTFGQINVPAGTFTAIAAAGVFNIAIRTDGTLVGWGTNASGVIDVPSGTFTAIAVGSLHSVALRTDGTLAAWGSNNYGQTNVPAGTFTAIAAAERNSFAIRSDGTIISWGDSTIGSVPAGTFTAIAARTNRLVALGNHPNAPRDFNGDNKSDVLWRDTTGKVYLWQMNGFTVTSDTLIANIWPDWKIVGSGDFNADGKMDILWRDGTGSVAVWLMNGVTVSSYAIAGSMPVSWTIAGVVDFNADGKADILWRNTAGDVAIWLMNGASIASNTTIANIFPGWTISGTGDFNADGKADILWREDTGRVAIWLMNGTSVLSSTVIANIFPGWTISGTGDFNADGKADILWRESSGDVGIWLMNGTSVISTRVVANIWMGWSIAAVGDFNADGKADILWRDGSGNISMWFMDGTAVANWSGIGNVADRVVQ